MYRQSITIVFFILFSIFLFSFSLSSQDTEQLFSLNQYLSIDPNSALTLGNSSDKNQFIIDAKDLLTSFTSHKFLVMECEQEKEVSGMVILEFSKNNQEKPSLHSKIGLLPGLRTYMVFPTSYLDGQQIFLPRFPRQMKGVVFGNRVNPGDLSRVKIYAGNKNTNGIKVYDVFLSNSLPDFSKLPEVTVVDSLGQWKVKDWQNKIVTGEQWESHKKELEKLAVEKIPFPDEFSRFGGWKKIRFDSTGWFHTHFDGERWWFVDPDGYAFLSFGMDCVRPHTPAVLEGNENLFEYLPPDTGIFRQAYGSSNRLKTVDFFRLNMIRIFGKEWYENWINISRNKLVLSLFNTVGNWSLEDFSKKSDLPYILPLGNFPRTRVNLYRDFPDVFSPDYRERAVEFASQLKEYKDDPYLVGYFLRNEPQWAFGNNNLAFEMMATNELNYTRSALALWLQEKYKGTAALSSEWNLDITSFTDILNLSLDEYPSEQCREDLWEFSKIMVKKYVDVVSEETRKVDPNHLNLGMRYAYISSELLFVAGEAFDVYSINGYSAPAPPGTEEIFEKSGKPVLIGEFHFGATDRGLPSTGLRAVTSQKQRGIAYRYYLEQGFARPEVIGIHYFQWMDQSVMGRFDGENYNIGFNDILYQSYPKLIKQAQEAHKNVYPVAAGEKKPTGKKPKQAEVIAF